MAKRKIVYSHSRLSSFEQCPLKYKFKYIDHLKPDVDQFIEGFLGSKVHQTLEWLYLNVKNKTIPELDNVLKHFIDSWNKDFSKDIVIVKSENSSEHYFNLGIKYLLDYYNLNYPFDDNTIETEKKIFVNLDSNGDYRLIGYIDRLVHDRENQILEIHDYKTSNFLKSQKELDQDRQLAVYSLGIRDFFNEIKEIHLIWHFLAFNKKMKSFRTPEELEKLRKEILELIKKIESTTHFTANPSILCKWCEFRSHCPLFNGHKTSLSNTNLQEF